MNVILRAAALVLCLGPVACTAGCSAADAGSPAPEKLPAAADFRPGLCRSGAEPILELARIAARNDGARTVSAKDRTALGDRQRELLALGADPASADPASADAASADTALRAPLTDLTTAIGFVRIRLDGKTYEPMLLRDMDAARRALQSRCLL
jgi:hypothetical protein